MSINLRTCRRILKGLNLSDKEIIEVRDAIEGIAGQCVDDFFFDVFQCGDIFPKINFYDGTIKQTANSQPTKLSQGRRQNR